MKTLPENHLIFLPLRIFLLIVITFLAVKGFAQENRPGKSGSPYFFVITQDPLHDQLPLKNTSAEVKIAGVIADVVVRQEYRNEGINPLEAIYTFPASIHAAVYAMEMKIGERKIVARIEEKNKARELYTQAKTEGKRTSLLEQHRPNVFQMNVANIMPGDIIEVTMRYTELLIPEEGTYRFVYPAVIGPRYTGESNVSASSSVALPYTSKGVESPFDFKLDLTLSASVPVQHVASPTHRVVRTFGGNTNVSITLDKEEKEAANRDFILEYKLAGNSIESGLMLYEHNDEKFFMLMVQPPKRIIKEEIPPREYIFIVDVSGSMHGFPINTSKTLLRNLIVNLRPTDRFNVLVFESGAYWLANESLPAIEENVVKATTFLDRQQGGGGTNLLAAMKKALSFPRQTENLSRSFVVVTDGYVSVDKEVFDIIRTKADQANVFTFGIGTSVNRYLLEGMARAGQSEAFIVLNPNEADREAEKFRKYINNPVLSNIKKSFSGFDVYDVEPLTVPDVLSERPVIIYGKYRGKPQGTITIEGNTGTRRYKKSFRVSEVAPDENNAALRYLWARKKIQTLDDYNSLQYNEEGKAEVTRLGLKYNLLTAHTSFVAIEDKPVNSEKDLTTVKQPLPLPQGIEESAIGFEYEEDDDADGLSFHRAIVLPADFSTGVKNKILADIEKNVLPELNKYISEHSLELLSLEVIVGMDGKIITVRCSGNDLHETHQHALTRIFLQHKFTSYKLLRVWNIRIEF